MRAKVTRAGDVREGDVVQLARGPARKVTGVPFQSDTMIELAYEGGRHGSYKIEAEMRVWPAGTTGRPA